MKTALTNSGYVPKLELTLEQERAVLCDEPLVRVSACPGSGKTRTLVEKVRWFQAQGADPIWAVTFTNRAAAEMRERLAKLGSLNGSVVVDTFHGHCLRQCRQYFHVIGWRENLQPLPEYEAKTLWQQVCDDLKAKESWKRYNDPEVAASMVNDRIVREYRERLRQSNVMDFATIIEYGIQLAGKQLACPEALLLDEAQDTDIRQYEWIRNHNPDRVFMVGDLDQSIFGWRGARPEYFDQAPLLLVRENTEPLKLTGNYRCRDGIVQAAKHILPGVSMDTVGHGGGDVVLQSPFEDCYEEAVYVADRLKWITGTCAVLYRLHEVGRILEVAIQEAGLTYNRVDPKADDVWQLPHVRSWLAWMRVSENPYDESAFREWFGPGERFGTTADAVIRDSRQRAVSVMEALGRAISNEFMSHAVVVEENIPPSEVADIVLRFDSRAEFLGWYARRHLEEDCEYEFKDEETITLCTAHAAKGLEFDHVFICGLEQGVWPTRKNEDEDRRLLYVALTRARESVTVTCSQERKLYGCTGPPGPSKFMDELYQMTSAAAE